MLRYVHLANGAPQDKKSPVRKVTIVPNLGYSSNSSVLLVQFKLKKVKVHVNNVQQISSVKRGEAIILQIRRVSFIALQVTSVMAQ